MQIQSVIFHKKYFSIPEAEKWLIDHGLKTSFYGKGVDITTNTYRYRQNAPKIYHNFISKKLKGDGKGITLVLGLE